MANSVSCPLCDATMYLTEMESEANYNNSKASYMWVCQDCPGILLEWYSHHDTDAFRDYMEGKRPAIKEWAAVEEETNASTKNLLDKER